jgi:hypothetical protein
LKQISSFPSSKVREWRTVSENRRADRVREDVVEEEVQFALDAHAVTARAVDRDDRFMGELRGYWMRRRSVSFAG